MSGLCFEDVVTEAFDGAMKVLVCCPQAFDLVGGLS
jgi:hypothetical protein